MTCTNCGAESPAGRKFCDNCGQPLAAPCPNCGASNRPGARFCGECGTALAAQAPAASDDGTPTPAAERRLVSVLFADLVGFTPFSEEQDAEEVREFLGRYFDVGREIVARYGGTVEKFIGDAVMAVWGTPTAHEDDAERAVRAALEIVDAVRGLQPGVEARAGVLTGEAAVNLGAENQAMVAGDLVNTASRLQSVAPPGSVLVGEATMRAASGAIAFAPAGEHTLKGKASPVPAWTALRVVASRGGAGRSETLEAPFVGRDEELRLLKDLLHTTGRDPRIRLVSVTGPAGIGKTRLVWELEKYVDGVLETIYWHRGRSPAYGEGITLVALSIRAEQGEAPPHAMEEVSTAVAQLSETGLTSGNHFMRAMDGMGRGAFEVAFDEGIRAADAEPQIGWLASHLAGLAALWLRDVDRARTALGRLDSATRTGRAGRTARVSLRAIVATLEGRRADAVGGFREAIRGVKEVGSILHASQIGLAFALAVGPSDPEARVAAEQGREVFARVRARPWVEKADAVLNGEVPPVLEPSPIPAETPIL